MIHEFDTIIYPCKIWVTYDATEEELNAQFPNGDVDQKRFQSLKVIGSYAITSFIPDYNNKVGSLIRFENINAMTTPNIAHESVHAANDIFDYIGATISDCNNEPFAYLVSYIAKCCEEVLNK